MVDKLAAVRHKFLASLGDKANELEELSTGLIDDSRWQELSALLHKIAGSAGFYGELAIADLARELELQIIKQVHIHNEHSLDGAIVQLISTLRERAAQ